MGPGPADSWAAKPSTKVWLPDALAGEHPKKAITTMEQSLMITRSIVRRAKQFIIIHYKDPQEYIQRKEKERI